MSWNTLPIPVQHAATQALTARQLDAWKLSLAGVSVRRMSLMLNVDRVTIRDHLRKAERRLHDAGIRHDHTGWYLNQETTT